MPQSHQESRNPDEPRIFPETGPTSEWTGHWPPPDTPQSGDSVLAASETVAARSSRRPMVILGERSLGLRCCSRDSSVAAPC